jgi:purine catabolism regulator
MPATGKHSSAVLPSVRSGACRTPDAPSSTPVQRDGVPAAVQHGRVEPRPPAAPREAPHAEVTVASVAADRALGLRVLVGGDGLAGRVLAAHTSELPDPCPWLHGGELLMTTGLALDTAPTALRGYVERLAAAGIACLAVGTGSSLSHAEVPAPLVQAAEACGLPLLEVPERTPFLAVTEAVYARLAAARYAEQVRALDAQRALTAAAVHPGGVQAVVTALADVTGLAVLVTDAAGIAVGSAGEDVAGLRTDLDAELARLSAHGLHATASVVRPGRDVRVLPLGSQRLQGFVACGAPVPPGPFERQLVAAAVVLLTLELERLRGAADGHRRRRSDVATALLAAELPDAAAADLLASVGVRAAPLRAAVLRPAAGTDHVHLVDRLLDRLAAALPDVLVSERPDEIVALVVDAPADLVALLRAAADGTPLGVGAPVRPGAAVRSARQASRAARSAAGSGAGVVDVLALPSLQLLLGLDAAAPGAVAAYTAAVLGPLDDAGPRGAALAASARAFLERNGSWEEAAAHLGVHRHTLRQRLRRVEELTGRRLDSGRDRMELLLALEARDLELPG